MKVRMLASAPNDAELQFLTTFLVNDTVAIDAGCAGFQGQPSEQARIDHIFLTHSHADHVCSLPMLITNARGERRTAFDVYGHDHVLASLRTDVFNGRLWPDLLSEAAGNEPFAHLHELHAEEAVQVDGLRLTPVFVDHPVPTFGYIVDDGSSAVVFCSDTAPTDRIWELAGALPHLEAVFLGVSFPNEEAELATIAGHLTPRSFGLEVAKLPAGVDVIAVHIKPGHRDHIVAQLEALGLPSLGIGVAGRDYDC